METMDLTVRTPDAPVDRHAEPEFEVDVCVVSKTLEADAVVSVMLRPIGDVAFPVWSPGAHVDLILDQVDGPPRQYSLCGDPADRRRWRLGVLRDPDGGGGSKFVYDQMNVGDTIRVRGPRCHFPLVEAPEYLFIAGGIGITPLLPMIAAAERAGSAWRLAYGGRSRASMAFVGELASYGDRVSILPEDETGLLDLVGLISEASDDALIYCCGPGPLVTAVEMHCESRLSGTLHVERFEAAKSDPSDSAVFEVHLAQSRLTLTVAADRSLLEVLDEAGMDVLSSCERGTCGTCEVSVLEGKPDHRDTVLTPDEREANDCMMACVSRCNGSRLVLDL